ncbi:MAG TPA: Maf family protein [Clostridia bacterium]|nr:Maf family protein [Clostridia bacterium]
MLILASASPRRSELLRNADIAFQVKPAHVPEVADSGEAPLAYAKRLARDKARAISAAHRSDFVLGADTVVIVDEHLLEKPRHADDAARMLRLLSGRVHQVTTGVCLIGPAEDGNSFEDVRSATTEVTFNHLSDDDIRAYISSGEPMDKAGAYAIQGIASRWIPRIDGCYFNVVGLPVPLVFAMLRERLAI